jgi:hypothetical protein
MPVKIIVNNYEAGAPVILDGNATEADVVAGKTFYADDAETKKTGTNNNPFVDWLRIDDVAAGNIALLVADRPNLKYALVCTATDEAQYRVNWGDGTTDLHNSGVAAEHTYVLDSGTPCAIGYTMFKITISPVAGSGLLTAAMAKHSGIAASWCTGGLLAAAFNSDTLTSLSMFSGGEALFCPMFVYAKVISGDALADTSFMFYNCTSLAYVDVSALAAVTNAEGMFYNCPALAYVDVSTLIAIINARNMFGSCTSLAYVDVSALTAITNAQNMFSNCSSIANEDVSALTAVTNAQYMFSNCSSLVSVDISALVALTSVEAMFDSCQLLVSVTVKEDFDLDLNVSGSDVMGRAAVRAIIDKYKAACGNTLTLSGLTYATLIEADFTAATATGLTITHI